MLIYSPSWNSTNLRCAYHIGPSTRRCNYYNLINGHSVWQYIQLLSIIMISKIHSYRRSYKSSDSYLVESGVSNCSGDKNGFILTQLLIDHAFLNMYHVKMENTENRWYLINKNIYLSQLLLLLWESVLSINVKNLFKHAIYFCL